MATITPAQQTAIANLYTAMFNRAPDAAGFEFWTQALANGASIGTIARAFVSTPEAQATYPSGQTSAQFMTAYYTTVLNRTPDAAGLAFWTQALEAAGGAGSAAAKALIVSQIVDIVNTPLPVKPADLTNAEYVLTYGDRNTFVNKGTVGVYYASVFKGNDLTVAKQLLSFVTADAASVNVAEATLNPVATPPVVPVNVILVEALENLTGTSGADSFTGLVTSAAGSTLTAGDVIDAGAGIDTLTVELAGTATAVLGGATVSGIEVLNLRNAGTGVATLDASTLPALTAVNSDRSGGSVVLTSLAQGTTVTLKGDGAAQLGNHQLAYDAKAETVGVVLDGSANAVKLGTLQIGGTALSALTISSTGAANTVTSLNLGGAATLASVNILADAALSVTSLGLPVSATLLTIKGAGAVDIGSTLSNVSTINAADTSGGVSVALGGSTTLSFTGGKGNDVVKTGAVLIAGASVDAGAGSDTLIVTNSAHLGAVPSTFYRGFEKVGVLDGVTANISTLAANNTISTIQITDGTGVTGVTGLTAAQAANIEILAANGTGAITIGLAVPNGASDTVKATVNTANGNAIDLTAVVLTGVENLELTGNGNGSLTLTTGQAQSLHTVTITNAGVNNITVSGGNKTDGIVIDTSTSTGATTIDASAHEYAITLKGGSGGNVLLGSNAADTIIGGAGDDYLLGDGSRSVGSAEVQTVTFTGTSTSLASFTIGGISRGGIGPAPSNDEIAEAFVSGGKAELLAANPTLADISYNAGNDTFTFTYKPSAGDVAPLSVTANNGLVFGAVVEATKGVAPYLTLVAAAVANADTLTGGAGHNTFAFAQNSSIVTAFDTITDLKLGTADADGRGDTLVFQNTGATKTVVVLGGTDVTAVSGAGSLAAAVTAALAAPGASADGATLQFVYAGQTYLLHNGDGNTSFNTNADFLVKITGVTGTLDLSDITLV
jgi:hypothetical protein